MIVRIVKMHFTAEGVDCLLQLFDQFKEKIASQPGCRHLELLAEKDGLTFMTYSHWESEDFLHQYRKSDTFGVVWPQTKAHFSAPPEAWTLEVKYDSQA